MGAAEEACGTPDQHDDDDEQQKDREPPARACAELDEGLDERQDESRGDGTREIAEPRHDAHDEGLEHGVAAERRT